MGCDIHGPFIERLVEPNPNLPVKEWWEPVAEMEGIRDYRRFVLLAGVRSRAEPVVPTNRGKPASLGWKAAMHMREDTGCHHRSWVTLDEMRIVSDAYRDPPDIDYGDTSEADLMVALMEAVEARYEQPSRAVFCFDN